MKLKFLYLNFETESQCQVHDYKNIKKNVVSFKNKTSLFGLTLKSKIFQDRDSLRLHQDWENSDAEIQTQGWEIVKILRGSSTEKRHKPTADL